MQQENLQAVEVVTDTFPEPGLPDGNKFGVRVERMNRRQGQQQKMRRLLQAEPHPLQSEQNLPRLQQEPSLEPDQERLPQRQRLLKLQQNRPLQLQQLPVIRERSQRGFVKEDARWRRRIQELRREAMRRRTSREIFKERSAGETTFAIAGTRELQEAREKEELRRLRLVDPLVRAVERRRYTVQWWPNFAREALPRLLTALRQADVLVEVRDARLPWLTQLPLQIDGNAIVKPRVVVLTHADAASDVGNAHWARFFRFFYRLQAAEQLQQFCRDAPEPLRLTSSTASAYRSDSGVSAREAAAAGRRSSSSCSGKTACLGAVTTPEQQEVLPRPQQHPVRQQQHHHQPEMSPRESTVQQHTQEQPGRKPRPGEKHEKDLVPPVPPATPVVFINARQDGAGVVRLEKAVRRIWRKWHEFHRDVAVFRRRVRQWKLRVAAAANSKKKALTFLPSRSASAGGDAAATSELVEFSSRRTQLGDGLTVVESQQPRVDTSDGARGHISDMKPNEAARVAAPATIMKKTTDARCTGPSPTAGSFVGCASSASAASFAEPLPTGGAGSHATTAEQQRTETQEGHRDGENEMDEGSLKCHQRNPSELLRGGLRLRRPLRLLLVGMPNVGKSALCNRLLHAKKARSHNYPGVSRVVTHYRRRGGLFDSSLHRLFDCIDSPGLLPPRPSSLLGRGTVITENSPSGATAAEPAAAASLLLSDSGFAEHKRGEQHAKKRKILSTRGRYSISPTAVLGLPKKKKSSFCFVHPLWTDDENIRLLAALNMIPQSCLGTVEEAAVAFLHRALHVWARRPAYVSLSTMASRYHVDPLDGGAAPENLSGCEYLHRLAQVNHHCCTGAASQRVMTDLQKGYLGRLTLEVPPTRQQLVVALASLRQQQLMKKDDHPMDAGGGLVSPSKRPLEEKEPLHFRERLQEKNPEASENTAFDSIHCRSRVSGSKELTQGARCTQIGGTTNVLEADSEAPRIAELGKRLHSQPHQKNSETSVDGDPESWVHYTCNEPRAHAEYASARKSCAHIFVWTPASKNVDNSLVGSSETSCAPNTNSATTEADTVNYRRGASVEHEDWETGAYEGW